MKLTRRSVLLCSILFAGLAVLAGCASAKASRAAAPAPTPLTVVSYNIRVGLGTGDKSAPNPDPKESLESIAAFLRNTGADIVLLQEVDRGMKRSGGIDEAAILAGALGFHSVYEPALTKDGGEYGIALLSRWPILRQERHELFKPDYSQRQPPYPDYYAEQRLAILAEIDTPGGPLVAIDTHLGLTNDQRARQLEQIAALVADEAARLPVIFGGDLNSKPEEPELAVIRSILHDSYDGKPLLTFPWDTPDRCIDYVFVSPDRFTVESVTVPDVFLSDHRPVVVRLKKH